MCWKQKKTGEAIEKSKIKNQNECVRVVVESSMTVYEAEKLRKKWAVYLNFKTGTKTGAAAGVNLVLKHVNACDITGVQLLCSARKTAALNHKIFTVSEASEEVIKAVSDAGLDLDKLFAAA